MERIRDFLYDISDLLISLLIIAAIFMVISWKLNETIPIEAAVAPPPAEEPSSANPATPPADSGTVAEPETLDIPADASDADKPIDGEQTTPPVKPTKPAVETGKPITITIPSGSPGVAIGKILKENGLITDVNAFIQKVDALGLGPKLRSGSFQLKTGMDLEQIIKTLANVN